MRLADEGRIDLDAPVGIYLTRWQLPDSTFDADAVTVRGLLSHSAGISVMGYLVGTPPGQEMTSLTDSLSGANGAGEEHPAWLSGG